VPESERKYVEYSDRVVLPQPLPPDSYVVLNEGSTLTTQIECFDRDCIQERIWCTWAPMLSLFYNFENFKISHIYVSKIMALKYIGRYLQEECIQKNPFKKYIVFWEI
jgi:hypothetical protein